MVWVTWRMSHKAPERQMQRRSILAPFRVFLNSLFLSHKNILFFVVLDNTDGWVTVIKQLPEHAFDFTPQGETLTDKLEYFQVWLSSGLAAITSISVVQRAMASKSEHVAQNAFYIAGIIYLLFGMFPIFPCNIYSFHVSIFLVP